MGSNTVENNTDKLVERLLKEFKKYHEEVQKSSVIIDQLRQLDTNRVTACAETKSSFTVDISKLTSFLSSLQSQIEVLIKEVKEIKTSYFEHDKRILLTETSLQTVVKDKERIEDEIKKVFEEYRDICIKVNTNEAIRNNSNTNINNTYEPEVEEEYTPPPRSKRYVPEEEDDEPVEGKEPPYKIILTLLGTLIASGLALYTEIVQFVNYVRSLFT